MQPFDYRLAVQNPVAMALQGYMQGQQFQNQRVQAERDTQLYDMQMQQYQMQQQELARQQARAQEVQSVLAGVAGRIGTGEVTAEEIAQIGLQFPEISEQVNASFEKLSEAQKQGQIKELSRFAVALSRSPEAAMGLIDQRIAAAEEAGDVEQVDQLKAMKSMAEMDPTAPLTAVMLQLGTVMDPEQFKTFYEVAMPPPVEREVVTTDEGVFAVDLSAQDVASGMQRLGAAPERSPLVQVGGELSPGFKKRDELFADIAVQWDTGGGADALAQLTKIEDVVGRIDRGESISGGAIGFAPDLVRALANPNAQDAKETVEDVVQRNLRVILGAQFTAAEGERLIARAFNPRLSPEVNRKRLQRLFTQMRIAAEQKQSMVNFFNTNGTLQGYTGRQPSVNDFYSAIEGETPAPSSPSLSAQEAAELEMLEALERGGR